MKLWLLISLTSSFGIINGTSNNENGDEKQETKQSEIPKFSEQFLKENESFFTDESADTIITKKSVKLSFKAPPLTDSAEYNEKNKKEEILVENTNITDKQTSKVDNFKNINESEDVFMRENINSDKHLNENSFNFVSKFSTTNESIDIKNKTSMKNLIEITNETVTGQGSNQFLENVKLGFTIIENVGEDFNLHPNLKNINLSSDVILKEPLETTNSTKLDTESDFFEKITMQPETEGHKEDDMTLGKIKNNNDAIYSTVVIYAQPYQERKEMYNPINLTIVYPDKNSEYVKSRSNSTGSNEKHNIMKKNETNQNVRNEKNRCEKPCIKSFSVLKRRRLQQNKRIEKDGDRLTKTSTTTERSLIQLRHNLYTRRPMIPIILKGRTNKTNEQLREMHKFIQDLIPNESENLHLVFKLDPQQLIVNMKMSEINQKIYKKEATIESSAKTNQRNEKYEEQQRNTDTILKSYDNSSTKEQINFKNFTDYYNSNLTLNESTLRNSNNNNKKIPQRHIIPGNNNDEKGNGIAYTQMIVESSVATTLKNTTTINSTIKKTEKPFKLSPEYNSDVILRKRHNNGFRETMNTFQSSLNEVLNLINHDNPNNNNYRNRSNRTKYLIDETMKNMLQILNNLQQLSQNQQEFNRKNNQENKNYSSNQHNPDDRRTYIREDNESIYHDYLSNANYELKKIAPKIRNQEINGETKEMKNYDPMNNQRKRIFLMTPLQRRNQINSHINKGNNQLVMQNKNLTFYATKDNINVNRNNGINSTLNNNREIKAIEQILKNNLLMAFEKIKMEISNNKH